MANEFVRKIKKTDVSKEPLSTNTQGDIILDQEKGAFIRYKDEYRKISGISNLTFNTKHVTLKNTTHDGTKRIELSEELLDKINNPTINDLTFNTEHVTLTDTEDDGTKRIELSKDLLDKINNPIQSGITTVSVKGNEWNEQAVTFKTPFSTTPTIVATNSQSRLDNLNIQTKDVTTKGFTLRVFSTTANTSTAYINWIAVPRT